MKDEVIESLITHTPLSQLHAELEKRLDMDYVDLLEWRLDHYPSVQNESNDITCASYEISMIVKEWYLESQGIQIPYYQYTNEDFEFSTLWGNKSTDYSTKFLLPVVQQLLTASHSAERPTTEIQNLETGFSSPSHSMEDLCVDWGGEYNRIKLVSTCSIDNFITILSLHLKTILESLELASTSISEDLGRVIVMVKGRVLTN